MPVGCKFGSHRSLEPKGSLPQPAWKLDTNLPIYENELLVNVEVININSASFAQLLSECGQNAEAIAQKVLRITKLHGKLQNPVTGSGGMLLGTVREIGKKHPAYSTLKTGDRIATLVSLTLTPLRLDRVKKVGLASGQIDVEGYAILFESSLFTKLPSDVPERLLLALLDEAGAPVQAFRLAKPGDTVLVVGAGGKIGVLSMFAARDRLGPSGKIIAVVRTKTSAKNIRDLGIADEVMVVDATEPLTAWRAVRKATGGNLADLTIDCVNIPGTEILSVMATREKGRIYFAALATRFTVAALVAEGLGKDVELLLYKGYTEGHADYAIQLLRGNKGLQEYLQNRLIKQPFKSNGTSENLAFSADPETESQLFSHLSMGEAVLHSKPMRDLAKTALRVAPYDTTVLITGESGVGKEILAQLIHRASERSNLPLVKINCAAIPDSLLEAELFGYEGGSFTGALREGKIGIFESARGGTLFLDEIGELPLALQAKLLRVIQEKEVMRVGGNRPIRVDVRIVAATNRDLRGLVAKGLFREDLYYRLNVVPLIVPPLRERKEAIPALVEHFLRKYNEYYKTTKKITPKGMRVLYEYSWPGNVREMENLIQKFILFFESDTITEQDVLRQVYPPSLSNEEYAPMELVTLDHAVAQAEKRLLEYALKQFRTTREIAAALHTSQSTVVRKLKKYDLQ